jgi:hypothetical protein
MILSKLLNVGDIDFARKSRYSSATRSKHLIVAGASGHAGAVHDVLAKARSYWSTTDALGTHRLNRILTVSSPSTERPWELALAGDRFAHVPYRHGPRSGQSVGSIRE